MTSPHDFEGDPCSPATSSETAWCGAVPCNADGSIEPGDRSEKHQHIFAIYGISDDSWTCVPHVPNISFEVDPYHEGSRGLSPSKRRFGKSKWWSKHLILPMLLMPQPSGCLRKLRKYTRRCVQPALSARTSKVNQSSREWGRHRHQAPANRIFTLDLNQGVDTATDKRATKLLLIEDFFPELGKSNYFELIPLDSFSMLDHQMDIKLIYQVACASADRSFPACRTLWYVKNKRSASCTKHVPNKVKK